MERFKLGEEVEMSRVLLGFWRMLDWGLDKNEVVKLVESAIDMGITTMDHADVYGNYTVEEAFGDALADRPDLRERIEIVSKATIVYPSDTVRVKYYDTSAKWITQQVERSLKHLRTDYLDVFLLHRPSPLADPHEIAQAFRQLKDSGKVRSFGVSNYKEQHLQLLESVVDVPLVTNQLEVSVLQHENFDDGTIAHAQRRGMHPIIWSPLAGGRIFTSEEPDAVRVREILEIVREEIGADTIDEVAFAWLATHPAGLAPITGSCETEFIKRAVSGASYRLTPEQWFWIWSAQTGHKVL
ncbi:MAG: aldo/keto reductase [Leucobacter sp.]